MGDHPIEHLIEINQNLYRYLDIIWSQLDSIIRLVPEHPHYVWNWRLQQEHEMKSQNGGIGMSDDQIKQFISRYMPMYEIYNDEQLKTESDGNWKGKGLKILINQSRLPIKVSKF